MKMLILFIALCSLIIQLQAKQQEVKSNNISSSTGDGDVSVNDFCPISRNPYLVSPSPEPASFLKYGEYPVSYNTGIPDISFPVYTIQTRELTFPIALSYYAGGGKVGEPASWVGLGWSLKTEGVVNCSIQSLPDPKSTDLLTSDKIRQGQDLDLLRRMYSIGTDLSKIDRMYDRYDYAFANSGGSFFMENVDKSVQFPYTSNKIVRLHSANGIVTQGFIITTSDGTSYYFKEPEISNVQSYCYNYQTYHTTKLINEYTYPSCWHLSKIVSCNKTDSIVFTYEQDTNLYRDYNLSQGCSLNKNYESLAHVPPVYFNYITAKNVQLTPILKEIKFDSGKILFSNAYDRTDARKCRLSQIQVQDDSGNLIKKVEFKQSNFKGGQLKLEQISYKGENDKLYDEYTFGYLNEGLVLPSNLSGSDLSSLPIGSYASYYSQDLFGYFNGKQNASLIQSLPRDSFIPELDRARADRSFSLEYASTYTLNKIKYITGGETEFVYGGDSDFRGHNPALRIDKIITSKLGNSTDKTYKIFKYYNRASFGPDDSRGLYREKSFSAKFPSKDYDPVEYNETTNYSSDPLMPGYVQSMRTRYNTIETFFTGNNATDTIKDVYEYDNEKIIFRDEQQNIKLPFSEHKFDIEAYMETKLRGDYGSIEGFFWRQDWLENNIAGYVIDNSWTDPCLARHYVYKYKDHAYQLIEKMTNQYRCYNRNDTVRIGMYLKGLQYSILGNGESSAIIYAGAPYVDNYYFFDIGVSTGWKKLISSVKENLDGNAIVKKQDSYQYGAITGNHPFVTSYTEDFGDFGKSSHTYKYVYDLSASDSIIKNRMIANNYISPVIGETIINTNGQKTPMVVDKKNDYDLVKSSGQELILLKQQSELITKFDILPKTKIGEYKKNIMAFDKFGNPLQIVDEAGQSMVYLWSYNYKYLVAKIQNATLAEVVSNLGVSVDAIGSSPEYISQVDNLRGKLPNTQIWTYTYQPLVGKLTETDPNGMTIYYRYDDCNRLKDTYLKNGDKEKLLQSSDYHYQNQ